MSAPATRKTSSAVQLPGADASLDLSALNAHIAAELAAGLSDAAAVRDRYGISAAQWQTLKNSPVFRQMLADAVQEYRGDLKAGKRIQMKADVVIEDAIPAYDSMIHNPEIPAQARIDAGKLLAQLAGRNQKVSEGAVGGGGFTLNINLGNDKSVTIDGTATPAPSAE